MVRQDRAATAPVRIRLAAVVMVMRQQLGKARRAVRERPITAHLTRKFRTS